MIDILMKQWDDYVSDRPTYVTLNAWVGKHTPVYVEQ